MELLAEQHACVRLIRINMEHGAVTPFLTHHPTDQRAVSFSSNANEAVRELYERFVAAASA